MGCEAVNQRTLANIVVPESAPGVPVKALIAVLAEEGEDVKAAAAAAGKGAAPKPASTAPSAPAGAAAAARGPAAPPTGTPARRGPRGAPPPAPGLSPHPGQRAEVPA